MKTLTVAALICTIMALTRADALANAELEDDQTAETDLVKRTYGCSHAWTNLNGRCFHLVKRLLRWADAEKNCQSMGGNLASVHSYAEYCAIQQLTVHVLDEYKWVWIGGHDGEQEGTWLWSNGKKFTYWNWCPREPSNTMGIQHCLQMNYSGKRCWDDDYCDLKKPSVCVKSIG